MPIELKYAIARADGRPGMFTPPGDYKFTLMAVSGETDSRSAEADAIRSALGHYLTDSNAPRLEDMVRDILAATEKARHGAVIWTQSVPFTVDPDADPAAPEPSPDPAPVEPAPVEPEPAPEPPQPEPSGPPPPAVIGPESGRTYEVPRASVGGLLATFARPDIPADCYATSHLEAGDGRNQNGYFSIRAKRELTPGKSIAGISEAKVRFESRVWRQRDNARQGAWDRDVEARLVFK